MPFVPVADTLQVETVFEWAGQIVENTSYFETVTGWDEGTITTFLGNMRTLIETELLPLLSTSIQLVRLVGTLLDAVDAIAVVVNVSPPVTGSATGAAVPNNTSYVVTFATASRGRSNRGRNYVPGIPNNGLADDNHIGSSLRTGLLAYYTALRAMAADDDRTMVVVSRFSGVDADGKPIPRLAGVTTPVNAFTTFDTVLDSQRRRQIGRGA